MDVWSSAFGSSAFSSSAAASSSALHRFIASYSVMAMTSSSTSKSPLPSSSRDWNIEAPLFKSQAIKPLNCELRRPACISCRLNLPSLVPVSHSAKICAAWSRGETTSSAKSSGGKASPSSTRSTANLRVRPAKRPARADVVAASTCAYASTTPASCMNLPRRSTRSLTTSPRRSTASTADRVRAHSRASASLHDTSPECFKHQSSTAAAQAPRRASLVQRPPRRSISKRFQSTTNGTAPCRASRRTSSGRWSRGARLSSSSSEPLLSEDPESVRNS
mmetsp:Transcript_22572/g.80553  ORF Transcript_22572/g.80553 Transcript_22572/m.80553 type:complete len:277 (-) Transcript_22572:628-1458(-)